MTQAYEPSNSSCAVSVGSNFAITDCNSSVDVREPRWLSGSRVVSNKVRVTRAYLSIAAYRAQRARGRSAPGRRCLRRLPKALGPTNPGWTEQDALDVLGTMSRIHRELDAARQVT